MKALIVREAFGPYAKGEIINDPEWVEAILGDNNRRLSVTPFIQPDPPVEHQPDAE